MKKLKRIIFALDDELLNKIKKQATKERRTVSDYIRITLEDEMLKNEK